MPSPTAMNPLTRLDDPAFRRDLDEQARALRDARERSPAPENSPGTSKTPAEIFSPAGSPQSPESFRRQEKERAELDERQTRELDPPEPRNLQAPPEQTIEQWAEAKWGEVLPGRQCHPLTSAGDPCHEATWEMVVGEAFEFHWEEVLLLTNQLMGHVTSAQQLMALRDNCKAPMPLTERVRELWLADPGLDGSPVPSSSRSGEMVEPLSARDQLSLEVFEEALRHLPELRHLVSTASVALCHGGCGPALCLINEKGWNSLRRAQSLRHAPGWQEELFKGLEALKKLMQALTRRPLLVKEDWNDFGQELLLRFSLGEPQPPPEERVIRLSELTGGKQEMRLQLLTSLAEQAPDAVQLLNKKGWNAPETFDQLLSGDLSRFPATVPTEHHKVREIFRALATPIRELTGRRLRINTDEAGLVMWLEPERAPLGHRHLEA